ncbi:hypothetical protein C8Q77DRAFT_186238 [Trametes polyzona]|nr:hypothetical protein C8Q77DRAFT_186238 [Trametes polyzona]
MLAPLSAGHSLKYLAFRSPGAERWMLIVGPRRQALKIEQGTHRRMQSSNSESTCASADALLMAPRTTATAPPPRLWWRRGCSYSGFATTRLLIHSQRTQTVGPGVQRSRMRELQGQFECTECQARGCQRMAYSIKVAAHLQICQASKVRHGKQGQRIWAWGRRSPGLPQALIMSPESGCLVQQMRQQKVSLPLDPVPSEATTSLPI